MAETTTPDLIAWLQELAAFNAKERDRCRSGADVLGASVHFDEMAARFTAAGDRLAALTAGTATERAKVVGDCLMRVAQNVAKHTIQRGGWEPKDACFEVDLRSAEKELLDLIASAERAAVERVLQRVEGH